MSYQPGDKVFTKVKGFRHWPCRINPLPKEVHIPIGKFPIFFYGSHEVMFLATKDIFPFEKNLERWGRKPGPPQFNLGMDEITNNPTLLQYDVDPEAEHFLAQFYEFPLTNPLPIEVSLPIIDTVTPIPPSVKPKTNRKRPCRNSNTNSTAKRARLEDDSKLSDACESIPQLDAPDSSGQMKLKDENIDSGVTSDLDHKPLSFNHISKCEDSNVGKQGECLDENLPPEDDFESTEEVEPNTFSSKPLKRSQKKQNIRGKCANSSVSRQRVKAYTRNVKASVTSRMKPTDCSSNMSSLSSDDESDKPNLNATEYLPSMPSSKLLIEETPNHDTGAVHQEDNTILPNGSSQSENVLQQATVIEGKQILHGQETEIAPALTKADINDESISRLLLDDDLPLKEIIHRQSMELEASEVKITKQRKVKAKPGRKPKSEKNNKRKSKEVVVKEEPSNESLNIDSILPPVSSDSSSEEEIIIERQTNSRKRALFIEIDEDDPPENKVQSSSTVKKSPVDKTCHSSSEDKLNEKRHQKNNFSSGGNKVKQHPPNMEDRLKMINATIKNCLTKGNENFGRCLMVMKDLNELPIRLSDLAKCCDLMDTLKKCRKYKLNDEIKATAQNVYNRFLEIPADATQEEVSMASRCIQLQKSIDQPQKLPFQSNDVSVVSGRFQHESPVGKVKIDEVFPSLEDPKTVVKVSPPPVSHSKANMNVSSSGMKFNIEEVNVAEPLIKKESFLLEANDSKEVGSIENVTAEDDDERSFAELLRSIPGFELAKSTLGFGDSAEGTSNSLFSSGSEITFNALPSEKSLKHLLQQPKSIPVAHPIATEWPSELVEKSERDEHRRINKRPKKRYNDYHRSRHSLRTSSPDSITSPYSQTSSSSSSSSRSSSSRSSSSTSNTSRSSLATPNVEPVSLSTSHVSDFTEPQTSIPSFTPSSHGMFGGSIFPKNDGPPGQLDLDTRIQQLMQGGSGHSSSSFNPTTKHRVSPYAHKLPIPCSSHSTHVSSNSNSRPISASPATIISSLPLPPGSIRRDFSTISSSSTSVNPSYSKPPYHTHSSTSNAPNSRLTNKSSVDDEDIYSLLGV